MTARFQWLLSDMYCQCRETTGPYFTDQLLIVPDSKYTDLDDLLKIPYSATIKKALKSAKPGTAVRLHNVSRGSDLYVRRLTEDDMTLIAEIESADTESKALDSKIKDAVPTLVKCLKAERNKLAKLKKKYNTVIGAIRLG